MPFDGRDFNEISLGVVRRVLIEGRRRVEESWWQKTTLTPMPPHGAHCTVTAIARQNVLTNLAMEALARAIFPNSSATIETLMQGMVPWNDAPGRTKDEVLAAYDRAIAALGGVY
jgi:hypothetical protein